MAPSSLRRPALTTFCLLIALLAWDASDFDMRVAAWSGGPQGFALTEHWLLTNVLHDGGRIASWLLAVLLTLAVWWPFGPLRRLEARERVQLIVGTLLAVLAISAFKALSPISCPWDLSAFGGVARHVSHWSWQPDGGGGRCFPAGHASSGFAFVGGYFVWRHHSKAIARTWLVIALFAGFVFGVAQQIRGAHFMSHTLWTAWLCWSLALLIEAVQTARFKRAGELQPPGPPTPPPPAFARSPAPANRVTPPRG
ncbi:MAG: phosphatase PAP2 family protein [Rhizobacter sp.]